MLPLLAHEIVAVPGGGSGGRPTQKPIFTVENEARDSLEFPCPRKVGGRLDPVYLSSHPVEDTSRYFKTK